MKTVRLPLTRARLCALAAASRVFKAVSLILPALAFALLAAPTGAVPPTSWDSVGAGGGGGFYSPSFGLANPDEMWVASDMSGVYRSPDLGANWSLVPFQTVQGNRDATMRFCANPSAIYTVDCQVVAGSDLRRPSKSTDGGATFAPLAADPTGGECFGLWADPADSSRVLVTNWMETYFSANGGASFALKYTTPDSGTGMYVSGVFFDGANIFVGTSDGLLVSSNGGSTFAISPVPGIPAGWRMASFAGAKSGSTVRLFALITQGGLWNGIGPEDFFWSHQQVYSLDVGQPSWVARNTGLPTTPDGGGDGLAFVACAVNDIQNVYAAGMHDSDLPMVFKSSNGGQAWQDVLLTAGNQNARTGWEGSGGDRDWTYGGGIVGLAVAPTDSSRVAFTDWGFLHLTTDGGTSWRQGYLNPADSNPPTAPTPKGRAYRGVGLENTSAWWLTWSDANRIFASFTDIRGVRTEDGGGSWSFDYTGHDENTAYCCVRQPATGALYMATSTVHDMYESTYLQDARIDDGGGRVLRSTDNGRTWTEVHDFGHPVVWLAPDPNNASRMVASVIHSTQGGLFVCADLQNGASSHWTKVAANPPRTEGHPFSVQVLNDGAIVCSYSGRRNTSGAFTQSSGVFITTDGGATWADRSDTNMRYWTRDLVVDPHDTAQNTWYACVYSHWGTSNNDVGGLYRSTNRGQTWARLLDLHRIGSITVSPTEAGEAYIATEWQGLWHTANLGATTPSFSQLTAYPFRHPDRIFFNPFKSGEIWVTSFGNGLRVGTTAPAGVGEWQLY